MKRIPFVVIVSLIVASAGTFLWVSLHGSDAPVEPGEAALTVDPSLVIFDSTRTTEFVAAVNIKNIGKRRVQLINVTSSCGCTLAEPPDKDQLEPGESTTLRISGNPPGAGEKQSYVQIESDCDNGAVTRINVVLRGQELPVPRIAYAPDKVTLQSHRAEMHTVKYEVQTIERKGSSNWLTKRFEVPTPLTVIVDGPRESSYDDDALVRRAYTLSISGPVDPEAPIDLRLAISTTTSQTIPLRITSEYAPPVKAVPNTLFVDARSGDLSRCTRSLMVVGTATVSSLPDAYVDSPEDEWLQVRRVSTLKPTASVLAMFEVSLLTAPPESAPQIRRVIHIKTNHPDCPTIDVPVVIKQN
jgi:hypothetical protein